VAGCLIFCWLGTPCHTTDDQSIINQSINNPINQQIIPANLISEINPIEIINQSSP
jgi:hypothetical protein